MPTFTLANLKSRVYDRLDQNTALYPSAEVVNEINDSIRTYNLGILQTSIHVPGYTVASQLLYSTPSGVLYPMYVYFEGRKLNKLSLRKISLLSREWMSHTTLNYGPVMDWVPIGLDTFAIHPVDTIGGNDLLVVGVSEPTALAVDGDTITVPDEDAQAIADLTVVSLLFKEGGLTFAASSYLYTRFLALLKARMRFTTMKLPRYYVQQEVVSEAKEGAA